MDAVGQQRLAFIAGFTCRDKMDMVQHAENLKTMYGISLEAELIHTGFNKFQSGLPDLIKVLELDGITYEY